MKTISMFLMFALSAAAYGQEQAAKPRPLIDAEAKPDTSGERLKQLLRTADEFEQAGKSEQAAEARQKAESERLALLAHIDTLQAEINRLRQIAGGSPQVTLHLKVYEVSMTKLRRLGYTLAKLQGKTVPAGDGAKDDVVGTVSFVPDGDEALRFVESLRKENLAKVIAEPTLTTVSGSKATFNSGGKIPLPKPEKNGATPLDWQEYGMQAQLTPTLLGNGRLRIEFRLRASELDNVNVTHVGKETVPGVKAREMHTVAELQDGQTLAFFGLNKVQVETTESGVPIASSIPYVGSAFKSVKEERNETAMFVFVRPEVVQPASADNAATAARQPSDYDGQR
jgi:pilus assembly protein CpaC